MHTKVTIYLDYTPGVIEQDQIMSQFDIDPDALEIEQVQYRPMSEERITAHIDSQDIPCAVEWGYFSHSITDLTHGFHYDGSER